MAKKEPTPQSTLPTKVYKPRGISTAVLESVEGDLDALRASLLTKVGTRGTLSKQLDTIPAGGIFKTSARKSSIYQSVHNFGKTHGREFKLVESEGFTYILRTDSGTTNNGDVAPE